MTIKAGLAGSRRRKTETSGNGHANDRHQKKKPSCGKAQTSLPMLQQLFDCCRRVFRGGPGTVPPPQDVRELCKILDIMEAEDVGLSKDQSFFRPTIRPRTTGDEIQRVMSTTIYSCSNFSLCLFFIPAGGVIPLHNHPGMTVFNKLLLGSLHVKSYDWATDDDQRSSSNEKLRLAKLKANRVFTSPCEASVLYPTTGGNIHEFVAETPCAVLDVMGPPYSNEDGRDCSYYRDYAYNDIMAQPFVDNHGVEIKEEGEYGWLEEITMEDPPMVRILYEGPQIKET